MEQPPLTPEEASVQLQELDRMLYRRDITGIVYRNRKEKILGRIARPADAPHLTRRQMRALNPYPQQKHYDAMRKLQVQPDRPKPQRQSAQQMRRELADFIVRADDATSAEEEDGDDGDGDIAVDANIDAERKELLAHFQSVSVKFDRTGQYQPMFPPKAPKTLHFDFGSTQ